MDASTALLILAAIAPYLIWLIRFIMMRSLTHDWLSLHLGRVNSPAVDAHHGAVNKEELSIVDSDASSSGGPPPTAKYDGAVNKEELPFVDSNVSSSTPAKRKNTNNGVAKFNKFVLKKKFTYKMKKNFQKLAMVDSGASSSDSTPNPPPTTKYDVFLSFRGEDTRHNFTSHLHEALRKAGIDAYIDYRLNKGEEIGPSLKKAIQESQIYVIIFSKNYASSTWCLDELVNIIKYKKIDDAVVTNIIPVFYHVEPSTVRKQSGSYAKALLEHERRFKDKVQRWKDALFQVANLSGWHSSNTGHEHELVAAIVKDLLSKLISTSPCDLEGLVGMHKHVEKMEALLSIGSLDVRIVGIWGMAGIGKTTIAEFMFHKFKAQFESCSFIKNVREQLTRNGLEWLLKKCLSELLKDEDFDSYSSRSTFMKMRLQRKKILLVLDDVDNSIRIDDLVKVSYYFGSGSRTIITSRDMHVIKNVGVREMYHVPKMNDHDALQLFSLKAFQKNHPTKDYVELSEKVMEYCKGIPLALIFLGSFLYRRGEKEWRSSLAKLEKSPHKEIFDVLKISFDGLDDAQKNIFLDLACFFATTNMPYMKHIPDYYDLSADADIRVLIERSLISVDACGQIVMHDLVVAMGQEIVSQQFANNPDKPVRLWKQEDVYRTLTRNMGTETIRCISTDMCKIKKICLHPATFQKMYNLSFLKFYKSDMQEPSKVLIPKGLENLPDELRILRWSEYPLPSLPFSFRPKNLVELCMPNSQIKRLWDADLLLPNLKIMDLGYSGQLVELPDLSQTCNIEKLFLHNCARLERVYSSSSLPKLNLLGLNECCNLMNLEFVSVNCDTVAWYKCPLLCLPQSILSENLVQLWLPSSNLERLWDGNQHLPNLQRIYLGGSKKLVALPDLCQAPNIKILDLLRCRRLVQVYSSSLLHKLRSINVKHCHKLRSLNLVGKVRRRSSVLVAAYNYFDFYNLSFFQMNVSLSKSDHDNDPFLRLKVVSVPSSEILKCKDYHVDNDEELQRLNETLVHSLPCLTRLRWLHIPSSIGQFSQQLDFRFLHESPSDSKAIDELELDLFWTDSNTLEPAKSLTQYPCIERTRIKEESLPLEQLMSFENTTESGLLKVPNNMALFSFITELSLWRSDIVSVPARILGVSSFMSLVLCNCRSHQRIIDLPVSQVSKWHKSGFEYSNESTSFAVEFVTFSNYMRMTMKVEVEHGRI